MGQYCRTICRILGHIIQETGVCTLSDTEKQKAEKQTHTLENCNGFFPVRARASEKTNPPERFADGVLAEFKLGFIARCDKSQSEEVRVKSEE